MIAGASKETLPSGFHIKVVNKLLIVVRCGDKSQNVWAACRLDQGVLVLLRRFWDEWTDYDRHIRME